MQVTITNRKNTAVIDSRGAELQSFQTADGTEYIWQGDPVYWSGRSPVLFPIIGNLRNDLAMIEGKPYHIPKHGIARHAEFTLTEQYPDRVTFTLTADENTLSQYPFLFCLRLHYRITDNGLRIDYEIQNQGDHPMPFCFGTHPAFRCPLYAGERFTDYQVLFNRGEQLESLVYENRIKEVDLSAKGYTLTSQGISLDYRLFDNDALIFEGICSDAVTLCHREKGHGIRLSFAPFFAIGIWTPFQVESPFLCLEPWNGMAVRTDEGDDFAKKRMLRNLNPSETAEYYLEMTPVCGK